MTCKQKEMITAMRQKQLSYSVISKETGVSVNTIKTFCRRNSLTREKVKSNVPRCKNCGKDIIGMSGTRHLEDLFPWRTIFLYRFEKSPAKTINFLHFRGLPVKEYSKQEVSHDKK